MNSIQVLIHLIIRTTINRIIIIQSPPMKRIFLFVLFSGILIPYISGQPLTVCNNSLIYLSEDSTQYIFRIGKYDGVKASIYPNPDGGVGYFADPYVADNIFYYRYLTSSGDHTMASFDGSNVSLIPKPDKVMYLGAPVVFQNKLMGIYRYRVADSGSVVWGENPVTASGYSGSPIVYQNKLYFSYSQPGNRYELAAWDGTNTTLYQNPDSGTGHVGYPIIHYSKLFFRYRTKDTKFHLAKVDADTIALLTNPDNGEGVDRSPVALQTSFYVRYTNSKGRAQLAKCDGSSLTLIANPDTGSGIISDWIPVVSGSNLYFGYNDEMHLSRIAKFDGTTVTLVPNPDSGYGCFGLMQEYKDKVYFGYKDEKNQSLLAACDGYAIHVFANPDSGIGYAGSPVVYNNKLYFMYANDSDAYQLGQCDGSGIKLIPDSYMGSTIPIPPPVIANSGPYAQSLSNIVEMKASLPAALNDDVTVFPNPATGMITIVLSQYPATIRILDVAGRIAITDKLYSPESSLNVSCLSPGVYIICVIRGNNMVTKKFVKK